MKRLASYLQYMIYYAKGCVIQYICTSGELFRSRVCVKLTCYHDGFKLKRGPIWAKKGRTILIGWNTVDGCIGNECGGTSRQHVNQKVSEKLILHGCVNLIHTVEDFEVTATHLPCNGHSSSITIIAQHPTRTNESPTRWDRLYQVNSITCT